jgi:hypothetical protein
MSGKRVSFVPPVTALVVLVAGIAILLAIAPLHAQLPFGAAACEPAVNRPPAAAADSATTYLTVPVTITVLANDTDPDGNPLTVTGVTQPYRGSAVINEGQTITFKPAAGFSGPVQFTYVVKDGAGGMASASVDVMVTTLVLALGFEEGVGATAGDASGLKNNAMLGGATWTAAGRHGSALAFDGVKNLVTVPSAASLNLAQMTLEAWVKPSVATGWRNTIFRSLTASGADGVAYALYANSGPDGGPGAYVRPSGWASDQHASAAVALTVNEWHYLAATYDGTALRLFVDGVQVVKKNLSTPLGSSNRPLYVGGNPLWGEYFKGTVDDVRVYNRALTDIEILADMETPVR